GMLGMGGNSAVKVRNGLGNGTHKLGARASIARWNLKEARSKASADEQEMPYADRTYGGVRGRRA
ncbi:MAG: hypothetical protein QME41_10420, partial [Actinomycetota bacterium]|nr:hypothetical protein [Actinomycetota bacterium]